MANRKDVIATTGSSNRMNREYEDNSFSVTSHHHRKGRDSMFPIVLYGLLDDVHRLDSTGNKQTSVISWLSDGKAFMIRKKDLFTQHLLPPYFDLTNWDDFLQLIREWGFVVVKDQQNHSTTTSSSTNSNQEDDRTTSYYFANPLFVRDQAFLCTHMTRQHRRGEESATPKISLAQAGSSQLLDDNEVRY